MTVHDDTTAATYGRREVTDAERQRIAKLWQRRLRTQRTKTNNLVRDNHRRPIQDVEGLREMYEKLSEIACDAFAAFSEPGMYWPDNWTEYRRADEDARSALRYGMALHV